MPPAFSTHEVFPPVPVFVDITKEWIAEKIKTKLLYAVWKKNMWVDTYMVMNTTRYETRTKYSKEVS